ncbi:ABC transporter ATP-binding protein/permease [Glutamicibacter sp. MNS18]|uniref:ABC transporter transmembrane domain-containing protein n=1 Tax=Glutamicibacter sp. MNS18 TaxID=2989817 RepID=UPI002236AB1D|nr:ABC transporter ATP-binding protein [Glutamicibacter sp. MNS18]MCW4467207.1 ABC transporter ATP-binding protein/permease [Glutamicibacter sp. MNS18]
MSSTYLNGRSLLGSVLRAERKSIIFAVLLLSCWSAGEALVPAVIGATIDEAIGSRELPLLLLWIAILGACFAMLSFGYLFGSRFGNQAMNRQTHRLRGLITGRVLDPGYRPERQRMPGEISTIATVDTDVASMVIRQACLGISSVLGLLVCAGYLLWANWLVGVAVLVIAPLAMFTLRWLTPRLSRTTHQMQADIAASGAAAADIMSGVEVLRGIGGQATATGWYTARSRKATQAAIDSASASGRMDAAQVVISSSVLLVATALSAQQVLAGNMSVGSIVGVLGVAAFLATPLGMAVNFVQAYTRSQAAAERITDLLAESLPHTGTMQLQPRSDAALLLTLENGQGERISLPVSPGRFSVLVCADPALQGQVRDAISTLVPGRLFLDGTDVTDIQREHLPQVLRVVPHEAVLFSGSIAQNIFGQDTEATTASRELMAASGVDQLLEIFEDGLAHRVEGAGTNLSGGQRQRVALARALAGGPLPRILNDPTNAVDSVTEAQIAAGIRELRATGEQGTLLVVSTSPNLLHAADEVIFIDAHGSVRTSTHQTLAAQHDYEQVVSR